MIEFVVNFLKISSIHGLKYIVEEGRHWTERIFWFSSCALASWAMMIVAVQSWHRYSYNSVSFVQDTSYIDWTTSFPAVSVCETDADVGAISLLANRIFGVNHDLDLETFLKDIVYYEGKCYACKSLCNKTIKCTEDFAQLVKKARLTCENLIDSCFWNDSPFDCCKSFLPVQTETGLCFTINTIQSKTPKLGVIEMKSNQTTGPGKLRFKVYKDIQVYIHAEEDVPFVNHPLQEKEMVILGTALSLSFQLNEIDNDPSLYGIPVETRNCRFPRENSLKAHNYYSYSACVVECRAAAQIRFCNCTHHFMPKIDKIETCGIAGLKCLTAYTKTLGSLKTPESTKTGLVCQCPSSCNEPDFIIVSKLAQGNSEPDSSHITIKMESLPTTRFKRYIVRTKLDLTVNIGGVAGLFLGASLLSIVEILFFLFIRSIKKRGENRPIESQQKAKIVPSIKPKYHFIN